MVRVAFGFAIVLAWVGLAHAEERSGATSWYGEVRGATAFVQDSEQDILGIDSEVSLETGWMAEIAAGYAHGSGFRGDFTVSYLRADFDEIELEGFGSASLDGDLWGIATLANGYYDVYLDRWGVDGLFWSRLRPFVGGGIGAAYMEIDGDLDADGDFALAYQGSAGFSYAITPQWETTLRYTYFSALDPKFDGVEVDINAHTVGAGLRFRFY